MMLDAIQAICQKDGKTLMQVAEQGLVAHKVFELAIDDLIDYSHINICDATEYRHLFSELKSGVMCGPALYAFEFIGTTDNSQFLNQLHLYRETHGSKAVPAVRKNPNTKSNYLYVGKVKKNFWGRLIQHLGFYRNGQTQGLQLYHWMRGSGAKLRVHVHVFPKDMEELMSGLEVQMAQQLQPLIGKHK